MKTYNIFVSHSWAYGDAYEKLIKFFNDDYYFSYKNYSVPKNDPIHYAQNEAALRDAIAEKIKHCNVVLVMAGVYSSYSKWIQKEIIIAKKQFLFEKPVIAVAPWGAQKISQYVRDNADTIVGWNSSSIITEIKKYAS